MENFDFDSFPIELSGKTVDYICPKCNFDTCVPIDYESQRGFHFIYKDN